MTRTRQHSRQSPAAREPRTSYLIKRAQFAVYVQLEETLLPFGLTAAQYAVFSIAGHRDGMSSAQLARRFAVTPQTMIKLIASLEAKRLIRRTVDADNRRALKIALTAAGHTLLARCEAAVDRMETSLFAAVPVPDMHVFRAVLLHLLDRSETGPSLGLARRRRR